MKENEVMEVDMVISSNYNKLELPPVPKSVDDALKGPYRDEWIAAIVAELEQIHDRNTFEIIEDPTGLRVAKMRLLFQPAFDNDMNIKFKARLVLCGYSQIYGVDYKEAYSPTIARDCLLIVLFVALKKKFIIEVIDVKGAFLEGINHFKVYAEIPRELLPAGHDKLVVRVLNSIYGEKQAAFEWYVKLSKIERLENDSCIFISKENDEVILMITVHVDDIVVTGKDQETVDNFKIVFRSYVTDIKEYKDFKKYLGLEIELNPAKSIIQLSQKKYVQEILEKFCTEDINTRKQMVPIAKGWEFTQEVDECEKVSILPVIGMIRYLADCTRPDLLASLGMISSRGFNPNESYIQAMISMLSFLKTSSNCSLKIGNGLDDNVVSLFAFCDASHNSESTTRTRLGGAFYLGYETGTFYCYSNKDDGVAVNESPMYSELKALFKTINLILIYRNILKELGYEQTKPTYIFTDCKSGIELISNVIIL
jgi:hypothetical protein